MAKARLIFLDENEEELIHEQSLKCLKEIGVLVKSEAVLKILESLHLSPLYEWVYETAGKDHYVSVDKLQKELGWSPRTTTADDWIDTYKWYAQECTAGQIETGISHRLAWKQGILKLVKLFF